jgi:hypothetical protein
MRVKPWLMVPPLLLSFGVVAHGQSSLSSMPPAFVGGTTTLDGHTTTELAPSGGGPDLSGVTGTAHDVPAEVMHGLPRSDLMDTIPVKRTR